MILFLLLLIPSLEGSIIERHFKKAENKAGHHSMPGIDFIYMISLDKRPEKYQRTLEQFAPYGITPYRFSAVNGWELTFQAIDDLGVRYKPGTPYGPISSVFRHVNGKEIPSFEVINDPSVTYYCHSMSRGAIGCLLSHLSVLQDAYDAGYSTIWVLEDDVQIVLDPRSVTTHIATLDAAAPGWDIFFTDPDSKHASGQPSICGGIRPRPNFAYQSLGYYVHRTQISTDLMKLGLRFGSYSMIIRRSGIEKLLSYFKTYKLFFPYDMEYFFPPDIKLYASIRDIVTTTAGSLSDNAAPTY
jgi:hypothetical protein